MVRHLPLPCNEMRKLCCEIIGMQGDSSNTIEMVDAYNDYNRPFEYTVLMECFEFKVGKNYYKDCPIHDPIRDKIASV